MAWACARFSGHATRTRLPGNAQRRAVLGALCSLCCAPRARKLRWGRSPDPLSPPTWGAAGIRCSRLTRPWRGRTFRRLDRGSPTQLRPPSATRRGANAGAALLHGRRRRASRTRRCASGRRGRAAGRCTRCRPGCRSAKVGEQLPSSPAARSRSKMFHAEPGRPVCRPARSLLHGSKFGG